MSSFFPGGSSFFPSTGGGGGGGGISMADLRAYVRAFDGLASDVDIYVDNDTGSDSSGDGSDSSPFASIRRALLETAPLTSPGFTATIHLVNTGIPYQYPQGFADLRYTTIKGELITEESRTISAPTAQSNSTGTIFEVNGAALSDDEWSGRVGLIDGKYFHVTRNVGNVLHGFLVSTDGGNSDQSGLSGGETFALLSRTELQTADDFYVTSSYFLVFRDLKINAPNAYMEGANHTDFYNCAIHAANIGFVMSSTIMIGTQVVGAKIDISSGCWVYRANCSLLGIDDDDGSVLSGSNRPEVVIRSGAFLADWFGGAVWRNIQGIWVMGGTYQVNVPNSTTLYTIFDDAVSGEKSGPIRVSVREPASEAWPYGQGAAGTINMNRSSGTVDGDYFIEAAGGAQVILDSTVSVGTNGEDNAVSANGGSTPSSWNPDGTNITGGTPAYMPGHQYVGDALTSTEAGRLYVDGTPIAGDDAVSPAWAGKIPAVAAGSNGAQGFQVSGEVVIPATIVSGIPSVGDTLYVGEAGGVPADKGRWSTSKPTDSGDLEHHVGTVLEVIAGSPDEYRVLLTPNSLTIEVA